jgi:hypothetical protein
MQNLLFANAAATGTACFVRIFQGMFAAVLKDRFRLSASALGTNPFFGF